MGRYRKILVAFDGSLSSKNALKQAIRLSREERSWLKVLAVVPDYEGDLELIGVSNIKALIEGPKEKLISEAKEIADKEGATIITNADQGEAYERIVEVADAENCDLIVMGRRGIHRVERMLMGSVTARVIGHTKRDVLVVPRDTTIGWRYILLATDGSAYSEAATEHAINFAGSYGGEMVAVSIVDVTDEFYTQAPQMVEEMIERSKGILKGVRGKAEASKIKIETLVREGEPYQKIVEVAKEKKAGVIFMGSHGRKGIKKLLMGSVTEKVIGHAPCPVLVVKKAQ
jgi:nucleotide-binding universal stress UspA family protein